MSQGICPYCKTRLRRAECPNCHYRAPYKRAAKQRRAKQRHFEPQPVRRQARS